MTLEDVPFVVEYLFNYVKMCCFFFLTLPT